MNIANADECESWHKLCQGQMIGKLWSKWRSLGKKLAKDREREFAN
jgi:hypothetical protein